MIPNTITDDVADTLFIPLYMKCRESGKHNSVLKDPMACDTLAQIDQNFSKYDKALDSALGICIRAKFYDDITCRFIRNRKNPVVVFIGCGLDTRFSRLGKVLTDRAVFYELDLPQVIDMRRHLLPPRDNDLFLSTSMFETQWMDTIKQAHPDGDFLFVAEGVFLYFEKARVAAVMAELAQRFSGARILFDVTSSWMCRNQHKMSAVKMTKAPFCLELDQISEIETWAPNLAVRDVRHYGDFKAWKQAGFLRYWMLRLVPFLKNASRIVSCDIK